MERALYSSMVITMIHRTLTLYTLYTLYTPYTLYTLYTLYLKKFIATRDHIRQVGHRPVHLFEWDPVRLENRSKATLRCMVPLRFRVILYISF